MYHVLSEVDISVHNVIHVSEVDTSVHSVIHVLCFVWSSYISSQYKTCSMFHLKFTPLYILYLDNNFTGKEKNIKFHKINLKYTWVMFVSIQSA